MSGTPVILRASKAHLKLSEMALTRCSSATEPATSVYTEKDDPHPQVVVAFGFLMTN
jgi:hypothetical protein